MFRHTHRVVCHDQVSDCEAHVVQVYDRKERCAVSQRRWTDNPILDEWMVQCNASCHHALTGHPSTPKPSRFGAFAFDG